MILLDSIIQYIGFVIASKFYSLQRFNRPNLFQIDLITDILFLIDMVMNFRTTFVNADGLVILTSKKMATHYLKGWFIVDCLTAVPWQFLQLISPASKVG